MQGTHQGKSAGLWVAVAATSLLYAAAHPPWSLWPLALFAIAPVSAVLLGPRSRIGTGRAAMAGFLFGTLATWLLVAHWSYVAAGQFFPGLAGLGAVVGVVGSASLWSAAELLRTSIGYGNPWGSFAAALIAADPALSGFRAQTPVGDLLAVGGAPAVAFLAASVGASLGLAWAERHSVVARGRALAAGAVSVGLSMVVSWSAAAYPLLRGDPAAPREPLRVAMVQAGIGKSRLWESAGAAESFTRHVEITRSFETRGADLIVWPENSLAFLLDANVDKRDELRGVARERGAALLVGGSRSEPGPEGKTRVFNSAFLFPADGGEPLVYDKRVLLPFVEHVPAWVSPFLSSPWQGAFASGNSGTGTDLFVVKGWRIAPLLCLEAIYPGAAASRVADGADLLVNLSNDSWFDDGAGVEQHFALAMMRAAETRRPLLRVASTGVSALVAEDGLISWRLPLRTSAVALLDVVPPRRDSLFVRGGSVGFALLVLMIAAAAALLPVRKEVSSR
jgi:apolipoprotein N-acyltransferase